METSKYEMVLEMDHDQLVYFYQTMAKSHRNWSGGDPIEQMILEHLRDEAWKCLLESQFN